MPIPSQIKTIPSRQTVKPDFSVLRAPKENDGPVDLSVLAHVHSYPPVGLAGGPMTLHWLLKHGIGRGWRPRVIVDSRDPRTDVYDTIPVRNDHNVRTATLDYNFSQVVITHLSTTPKAVEMSRRAGRPLVHLVHNKNQLHQFRVPRNGAALVIFNSAVLKEEVGWEGPSIVMHPHVAVSEYATSGTGDAVTLVNLTTSKGAPLFYELARRNPGVRFIGVKGAYGEQVKAPELSNLEIWEPQPDIKTVMAETRLLLMPSERETWGRVAIEAACSGIPSICSATRGMLEAGVAESYLDLDFEKWNKMVKRFTRGPKAWEEASDRASTRAAELESITLSQLDRACERIESLV